MAELTPDQISALTEAGARRWQKSGMDRLYLSVYRLGLRIDKQSGSAWWGNQAIPAPYLPAIQEARVWIDVKTGNLGLKLGQAPEPLPDDIRHYYQTVLRQNAKESVEQTLKQAEWSKADHTAMNIKTLALKWRKGQTVTIDGKRLVVEEVSVDDSPFAGSARMICDARLVVRQFDGKFRRVDLSEVE